MKNVIKDGIVLPDQFARLLVYGDELRSFRRRYVGVTLVLPIRGINIDEVAEYYRRGVGHVMRLRSDFLHHVKLPDDVGVFLTLDFLVNVWAVILSVTEALRIERNKLGAVVDVIKPVAFDKRRRANALIWPVVDATRREFVGDSLPQEFPIRLAKGHQDTFVASDFRIAQTLVVS